jgi:hypothetical protein
MQRLLTFRVLAVVLLAIAASACDDETATTPTPATVIVTDTFTGAVTQNGAATHSFSVASAGSVKATLKSIGTDNTLVVGFSLGTWSPTSSTCSVVLANDAATGGAVLQGTMTGTGTLCVRMYDVGNVVAPAGAAYTVEVEHP